MFSELEDKVKLREKGGNKYSREADNFRLYNYFRIVTADEDEYCIVYDEEKKGLFIRDFVNDD